LDDIELDWIKFEKNFIEKKEETIDSTSTLNSIDSELSDINAITSDNSNELSDDNEKIEEISSIESNSSIKTKNINNTFNNLWKEFSVLFQKIISKLNSKWYRIDKKLIVFHINESIKAIVLLIIAIVWLFQAVDTYNAIDKLPLIKKYYQLKKDIKIEDEKIKENKKAEYLADILKFWVKTENWRYPEGWYLEAFNQVFPDNIWDLQLLTFLEWWSSEFIDYQWRKIRVDHWLIKTFKQDNTIIDNWMLKGYKYKLVLEWEPDKVDNFLYNIKYSNKIPKYFTKIDKKYNSSKGVLTVDTDILFYLSK
jgi:hypothetical protein